MTLTCMPAAIPLQSQAASQHYRGLIDPAICYPIRKRFRGSTVKYDFVQKRER